VVVKYADACVEGVSERCRRALDFSQLRRVVARAAGSVNLASGLAARRLFIGVSVATEVVAFISIN
jgi:hypothetical protein